MVGESGKMSGAISIKVTPEPDGSGSNVEVLISMVNISAIDKYILVCALCNALKVPVDDMVTVHILLGDKIRGDIEERGRVPLSSTEKRGLFE